MANWKDFIEKKARMATPMEMSGDGSIHGFSGPTTDELANVQSAGQFVSQKDKEIRDIVSSREKSNSNFWGGIGRKITGALGAAQAYMNSYFENVGKGALPAPSPMPMVPFRPKPGADPEAAAKEMVEAGKIGWRVGSDPVASNHAWSQLGKAVVDTVSDVGPNAVGLFSDDAAKGLSNWINGTWVGDLRRKADANAAEGEKAMVEKFQPSEEDMEKSRQAIAYGRKALDWAANLKLMNMASKMFGAGAKSLGAGKTVTTLARATPYALPEAKMLGTGAGRVSVLYDENKKLDEEIKRRENAEAERNAKGFAGRGLTNGAFDGDNWNSVMKGGLVGGLGGTLLGGLFGGWKNAWKLGLLGLLLGGMDGGGAFDGIMQSLRDKWGGSAQAK